MKSKKIRNVIASTHRYLGLLVGLILIIVGLTGSLLVFKHEIDDWGIQQQFGRVVAQERVLSPLTLIDNVKTAYADRPDWQMSELRMLSDREIYTARFNRPDNTQWEVFVNPYTGKIIGDRQRETAFFSLLVHLHYELLIGNIGMIIVGIAALLLCILTITGTILWSGWRKLWLGFKINWKAHPIRVNYDLHKVTGIIVAIFLGATLQVQDSRTARLGDRILNSFTPLHYGTFGGLPTRIFYVFVGIAPLILFITGSKMFTLRNWGKAKRKEVKQLAIAARVEHPESN